MSMNQTKRKQTKGKQKIEIKKVEAYGDRMITFSKRKSGILKKMNEFITLCNVETAFLVYSQAGKPYTFSHPSMNQVAVRLDDNPSRQEPSAKDGNNTKLPLLEAYKRQKIESLMNSYEELVEEFEMDKENQNVLRELVNEKELDKMWWNIPLGGLGPEGLKQTYRAVVELRNTACDTAQSRLGKYGDGSSSSREQRGYCCNESDDED